MRGYERRRVGWRRPHRLMVIVCEGSRSEPTYFRHFRERGREPRIVTPNTPRTDPVGLVRYAKKMVREYDLDIPSGDRIWCVFDVDENDDDALRRAVKLARPDVSLALSNPSFELWLLLHFVYDEVKTDNHSVVCKLDRHIPGFTKSADVHALLLPRRGDAIVRAKRLNEFHIQMGTDLMSTASNPSTQVFALVEEILGMGASPNAARGHRIR